MRDSPSIKRGFLIEIDSTPLLVGQIPPIEGTKSLVSELGVGLPFHEDWLKPINDNPNKYPPGKKLNLVSS